jgi:DNA-binding MarR family transcriptional regulator
MPIGPDKLAASEETRILLGLLESVERGEVQSQRLLASELGIALGLVNAYLKRCMRKGFVKMRDAPARRYVYYLTPKGFAEKSRLTVQYLSLSLSLYRRARRDFMAVLLAAREGGISRIGLIGASDLAEIAAICALEVGIAIVGVIDSRTAVNRFLGVRVAKSFDEIDGLVDAVLVTDIGATSETIDATMERYGAERVLVPADLLSSRRAEQRGSST